MKSDIFSEKKTCLPFARIWLKVDHGKACSAPLAEAVACRAAVVLVAS